MIKKNLFSKIASQNGTIKLFSGGKQIKSVVPLIDVVRCMKFMEENNKIKRIKIGLKRGVKADPFLADRPQYQNHHQIGQNIE